MINLKPVWWAELTIKNNLKMNILILGGGGFIGSAIARILSRRENYDITIVGGGLTGKLMLSLLTP